MQREIFVTIEFSQMGIQVGPMGVKRSGGESQKPRVSKAADSNGDVRTRKGDPNQRIQACTHPLLCSFN